MWTKSSRAHEEGRSIYVDGRLRTRKWTNVGVDHYATEVVASDMQMLGSKSDKSFENVVERIEPAGPIADDDGLV